MAAGSDTADGDDLDNDDEDDEDDDDEEEDEEEEDEVDEEVLSRRACSHGPHTEGLERVRRMVFQSVMVNSRCWQQSGDSWA